ncbi:MAG TPA: STAS domain-containing protein [Candidatus Krumholzibacteria bacterium]|jgi:anti-anti-sigma factor
MSINSDSSALVVHASGRRADGCLLLAARGNIDTEGAPILSEVLDQHRFAGDTRIVLDLSAVGFMSSCGVGTLVAAVADFRDVGGEIYLRGANASLQSVFEALDLTEFFAVDAVFL